ncbi:unnamed protein product [Arctia plantaginis]|uniref:Uncharacterized protein n=1 Tax=Arctia plantaginis TaxID=874455 RepID=A0A8S1BBX6_ARCPL|nr:unnamed protein product [Arctia plantaginis]
MKTFKRLNLTDPRSVKFNLSHGSMQLWFAQLNSTIPALQWEHSPLFTACSAQCKRALNVPFPSEMRASYVLERI